MRDEKLVQVGSCHLRGPTLFGSQPEHSHSAMYKDEHILTLRREYVDGGIGKNARHQRIHQYCFFHFSLSKDPCVFFFDVLF